jgi:hypothetical protein
MRMRVGRSLRRPRGYARGNAADLFRAEDDVTGQAAWPVLPLQEQLAPWLPMLIGLAILLAFVILVVDRVERL